MARRLALLALLATAGCLHTVRGASSQFVSDAEAQRLVPRPPDQVAKELAEILGRRGFHVVDRRVTPAALFIRFKGTRTVATYVQGGSTQGSGSVGGQSDQIGSVFDATLQAAPGGTQVWLQGRPTVQGRVSCEPPGPMPCDGEVTIYFASPGVGLVTGREEAETVRGALVELTGLAAAPEPPPAAPPAAAAPPPDFVPARVRPGTELRSAPDPSAPVLSVAGASEEAFAAPSTQRGYRRVRLASGAGGFAPEAAVELVAPPPAAAPAR